MSGPELAAWMLRSVALTAGALALQHAWPAQARRIPLGAFAALLLLTTHAFFGGSSLPWARVEIVERVLVETAAVAGDSAWLLRVYLLGVAVFLGRETIGALRLRALLRKAAPLSDEAWERTLERCTQQLGLRNRPELRVSVQLSPAAAGIWRRVVLLPPGCETWSEERRRFVLLHELAHFLHGDLLARHAARAVGIVQWFNPLVWLLAARMELDREAACDAFVAAETRQPVSYAETLLALATFPDSGSASWLVSTFGPRRRPLLEVRLRRLLAPPRSRPWWWRALTGAAALTLLLAALMLCTCTVAPPAESAGPWTPEELRLRLSADPFPASDR